MASLRRRSMLAFASAAQSLTLPSPDSLYAPGKLRRNTALTDALVRGSTAVGFEKEKGNKSADTEPVERALAYAYRLEIDSHIAQKKNGEVPASVSVSSNIPASVTTSAINVNDGHVSLSDVSDEVGKNNSAKVAAGTTTAPIKAERLSQMALFPMSVAQQQQQQQQAPTAPQQSGPQQQQPTKAHSRSSDRSQRLEMERTVAAIIKHHDGIVSNSTVAPSMESIRTDIAQHMSSSSPSSGSDSKEDDAKSSGDDEQHKKQRQRKVSHSTSKKKDKNKQDTLLVTESSLSRDPEQDDQQEHIAEPQSKKARKDLSSSVPPSSALPEVTTEELKS